jgi:L-alanine-DL-glutamate epimerase-like enolase superfamily enzyme
VEYIGGSPYVDGLLEQPFALDGEGMLAVPAGPGLGVRLDPANVRRYAGTVDGLFL